jgi:ABC-type transporter Mla MlaB component
VEIVSRQDVSGQQQSVLCLRGSLGIADVVVLRDAAIRLAAECGAASADVNAGPGVGPKVNVDMSEVEGMDAGILQILAALDAEMIRQRRRLEVQGLPEAVERQWQAAGWRGFSPHHS